MYDYMYRRAYTVVHFALHDVHPPCLRKKNCAGVIF